MPIWANRDVWVFDLDNTLYSHETGLMAQISARITLFCQDFFGLEAESARAIQKRLYEGYGTTLAGLMAEHEVDPSAYMAFVHEVDYGVLSPQPTLAQTLLALPGRRLVFTNATRPHAKRALAALGLEDLFEALHDLSDGHYAPKPHALAYERFCKQHAVDPNRAVFFEDSPHNLEPAHALGMRTVLMDTPLARRRLGDTLEGFPYIDRVTQDLPRFLEQVLETR